MLFNRLQSLRRIQPDAEFAARSRAAILRVSKKSHYQILFRRQLRQVLFLSAAMAMAVAFLFVLNGVSRLPLNGFSPGLIASLDSRVLTAERHNASLQLQLSQARYYKESTNQVTMAVDRLGENKINPETIERQSQALDALLKQLAI